MVKNYLVCAIRSVANGWCGRPGDQADYLRRKYLEMYEIRTASFRKFVKEPFEIILWQDPVKDNEHWARENWLEIQRLWHSEPCNIFWAGADTFMLQETELFSDRFQEYRLFNFTDPKSHPDFPKYYNDDIQYYPHTMSEAVWSLGDELWKHAESHPERLWGFDQLRHNHMFWAQKISDQDRCHPKMAYQAMNMRDLTEETRHYHDKWNGELIGNSHILHFHGSRQAEKVVMIMQELAKMRGI